MRKMAVMLTVFVAVAVLPNMASANVWGPVADENNDHYYYGAGRILWWYPVGSTMRIETFTFSSRKSFSDYKLAIPYKKDSDVLGAHNKLYINNAYKNTVSSYSFGRWRACAVRGAYDPLVDGGCSNFPGESWKSGNIYKVSSTHVAANHGETKSGTSTVTCNGKWWTSTCNGEA